MSYDDYEDWDHGHEEYELEIENRAIEGFQTDRLQSFYKGNKDLAVKPIQMWRESISVLDKSSSAALILAMASIEVGFKSIILRPIISGLVHEESLASLVTEVVVKSVKRDGVLKIVYQILKKYASLDLKQITLAGHDSPYSKELVEAQDLRNGVVHRAEACSKEDAARAVELADYLWNVIFVEILKSLDLHTHDNQIICDQHISICDSRVLLEKMKQSGELSLADRVRLVNKK